MEKIKTRDNWGKGIVSTCIGIDEGTCRSTEAEAIRVIKVREEDY